MDKLLISGIALIVGIVLFGGIVLAQSSQTNSENKSNENQHNHMQEMIELHEKASKENWTQQQFFDAMNKEMLEHSDDMPCHKNGGMMGNGNSIHGMMGAANGSNDSESHQKMHEQMHGSNNGRMMH